MFFFVVFPLVLPDVDMTLFITFITSCKTSSIKIWFVLAAGLAENLTQVVFRQPFVIQHVTVTTKSLRPPMKIIRFLGIASYCIIPSLRLHHTYCFSSVTSLNDLFSTQVNRVVIFGGFVLNFSNFKNCENGSKKVTKWSSQRPNCCFA